MFKKIKAKKSTLTVNQSTPDAMHPHTRIQQMVNNKEPLEDSAVPMIYTEKGSGVHPNTNIRTDRFDVAIDAIDHQSGRS